MKTISFFILILLLTVSCKPTERIVYLSRIETIRDTVITQPPDSSFIRILLKCDSLEQVVIENLLEYEAGERIAPPVVSIRDNILTAICRTDTVVYTFPIPQIEIKQKEIEVIDNTRHRFGEDLFYYIGIAFPVLLILFIVFKIIKGAS